MNSNSMSNQRRLKTKQEQILQYIISGTSYAMLIFSLFTVIAWLFHRSVGDSIVFDFLHRIKFNAAVLFIICALGLNSLSPRRNKFATYVGIFVFVIGGLTLLEHMADIHVGIDQLLLKDYTKPDNVFAGRMSSNGAFSFMLAGIGY